MKKSFIALVACSLLAGAAVASDHPEPPKAKPAAGAAGADGSGVLDGKVFSGQLVKAGAQSGDADQLTFKNGTFVSSACVPYGFKAASYTATEKDGVVSFNSQATNTTGDTMTWSGTIKNGVLEGTVINKSQTGVTTYKFKGNLGAAAATENKKKSEHPEHPEHPK